MKTAGIILLIPAVFLVITMDKFPFSGSKSPMRQVMVLLRYYGMEKTGRFRIIT
jgi:hypothetical protein